MYKLDQVMYKLDLLVIRGWFHKPLELCPSYNELISFNHFMFLFSQCYLQCWCHGKVNTQNLNHPYRPHFKVQQNLHCHTMLVSLSNNKHVGLRAAWTCTWQVTVLFTHFKVSFFWLTILYEDSIWFIKNVLKGEARQTISYSCMLG